MLEFFIEKYRSVDDLRDFTAEEAENIATMQSAHANILEYMYQHTIATKTQQKLSEAAYTVLVTVISTLPFAIAGAIGGLGKGVARGLLQLPKMLISETLEELFLDPWIESAVSGYAEEHGWNTLGKSLAVSFAESGRETFGSSIVSGFKNVFSTSTQASNEVNSDSQSQADSVQSASQAKADRIRSLLRAVSLTALSTIMLFAGFISPVAMIFGTSASYIGMAAVSTVKEFRQKELLRKITDLQAFGQDSYDNVQNLLGILSPSKVADPQTLLLRSEFISIINNKHSLITDKQKNKDKPESLLQRTFAWVKQNKAKIALYTGAVIAGALTTLGINALFADSTFGSLAGTGVSLGFGTIGMAKLDRAEEHKIKLESVVGQLVELYKWIDENERDPAERESLKQYYLKGASEKKSVIRLGIDEQTLKSEVSKRFAEVESVSRMSYFDFWEYYTGSYDNEYSKRMTKLDKTNIDIRSLTSVKAGDPSKVPDLQTKLLEKFMRAKRTAKSLKTTPYLIYAMVNKKKLGRAGRDLLVRVGYTQDIIKRQKGYQHDAKANKWGPVYDDMRRQAIEDFEFIFLDIQYGKGAAQISEEFFTIYFNRDPTAEKSPWSPKGVDLFINERYNPVIGDIWGKIGEGHPLYKEIYYNKVQKWIEKGYEFADIAIKLGVNGKTLFNRIRSWGEPGSDFNYDTWSKELRIRKLIEYYKKGMHVDEIAKQFSKLKLPNKAKIAENVEEIMKIDAGSLQEVYYSERTIAQWTNEYLGVSPGTAYEIYFVKPIILTLANLGFSQPQALEILEAMGVVNRRGNPYDKDSLNRMLKDRLWGPGQGLPWGGNTYRGSSLTLSDVMLEPIIENLIRSKVRGYHISVETIAELIDKPKKFVYAYIERVWGFKTITEARLFFDTHHLGHHRYDFFMFS